MFKDFRVVLSLVLLVTTAVLVLCFFAGEAKAQEIFDVRLMVVGMNPVEEGEDLVKTMWGLDAQTVEDQVVKMTADDFRSLSNGTINYTVVKRVRFDKFPPYTDGFQYIFDKYRPCTQGDPGGACEKQKFKFDTIKWVKENRICEIAEENNIDEIWAVFPVYLTAWENFMVGPNEGYNVNGPYFIISQCRRHLVFTTGNYDRISPLTHVYGHRIEKTMRYITEYWKAEDYTRYWENFAATWRYSIPTGREDVVYCGNAHFPSNSRSHYDYYNTQDKDFTCIDWKNFPNFQGLKESINCSAWGCNDAGWQKYWFGSLPRSTGEIEMRTNAGRMFYLKKNWWYYLLYPVNAITLHKITSGEITLTPTLRPTSTPIPTATRVPTSTPAPTATRVPTPTPIPCPLEARGDADCNGKIDLADFEVWRREFLGIDTTTKADFDSSGGVTIFDFEVWRRGFLGI